MGTDMRDTLSGLLQWRAEHQPTTIGYSFLVDGETEEQHITYAALDAYARSIAAYLQQAGFAGERALLLYQPGLHYVAAFFGCLYAGVVAVPAYPPNPARLERTLPRLGAIIIDARPAVLLTTAAIVPTAQAMAQHLPAAQAMHIVGTDAFDATLAAAWQPPVLHADDLAFLQYTSGSTAAPKGVMLSHRNLLHNSALIHHCFAHSSDSRGLIWLPPYHDMGLIGGIIQPLYGGFPVTLMSPASFLQRPLRWLEAISRLRATTSGGPNFAYDLCVRKVTPAQLEQLDLSSWTVAFNGAEPINAATLDRFAATFAPCGFRREAFYPCYGLAEATLLVSGGDAAAPPVVRHFAGVDLEQHRALPADPEHPTTRALVGSGHAAPDLQVAIVDPHTLQSCPSGQVGEIWVAGPSVAQGYWNRPEQTAETFQARIAESAAGPFLRTGDIGFLHDGELFVTGRLKDLIIIRGRNVYPQDIEQTVVQCHPVLRPGCGAAFSIEVEGEERLVIVQELDRHYRNADLDAVMTAIRQAVAAQHEVQVYAVVLIKTGTIPKTSSGKIQRHQCRKEYLRDQLSVISSTTLTTVAPQEASTTLTREILLALPPDERVPLLERYICERLAEVLRIAVEQIDPQQPVGALGLDSLMAVELQHSIEADLTLELPMASLLEGEAPSALAVRLAAQIEAPLTQPARHHDTAVSDAAFPLSAGQRALWFVHQLAPESAAYTIARAVRITTPINRPAFTRAWQTLIERHPLLRVTIVAPHGDPVQQVHPADFLSVREEDARDWSEAALQERLHSEAHRPFDLAREPLLRIFLFTRAEQETVLLLVVHHIVADFWSLAVLLHELGQLYAAEQAGTAGTLPVLPMHYSDYVAWQRELLVGPTGVRLRDYWQQQLAEPLPVLDLPTDHPRPPVQTYRGASERLTLDQELTAPIKALAQANGTTLSTLLLAMFQVLLFRYTGQTDILVGVPTAGRSRAELVQLVGYFVNPVVVRANVASNPTFSGLLTQVRQTMLGALMHQDYPLALLTERLHISRDLSRAPLFQVMYSYQQAPRFADANLAGFALDVAGAQLDCGGLHFTALPLEQQAAQFDLTLMAADRADTLDLTIQYDRALFEPATIRRMLEHLRTLLAGAVAQPDCPVAALPLLSPAEQAYLATWNETQFDYPPLCLHQLIEAQAARTPDATALVYAGHSLSYRALNERANQLAHHLQRLGVGPEVLVGLCMDRSLEKMIGLLAVLKAGAAYVPLDPAYPAARLRYVMEHARVAVLLTQERLAANLAFGPLQVLCLDTLGPRLADEPIDPVAVRVQPENLAYVIYTSGSTGVPKGIQISHRAVVNFLTTMRIQPGLRPDDIWLAVTTISFDIAALELFLPLSIGACVHIAPRSVVVNGVALSALIRSSGATVVQATPTTWRLLLEAGWSGDQRLKILCGGEGFPPELTTRLYERAAEVWNMYGPTETTIWSTIFRVTGWHDPVPIGRPIGNTSCYVLDRHLQPMPLGVPGELYIGGDGLARGYLDRPDLTALRFVPDPFSARPGARLYRTGDLVRLRLDGNIHYLGRIDQQVKVRGVRIELDEIAVVLAQHPAVQEAVATVPLSGRQAGAATLVAYVVPRPGHHLEAAELRRFLKSYLPDYMVPSTFVTLAALPLTPNGKVDRNALPAPELAMAGGPVSDVPPLSELERAIAHIWQDVLGVDQVSLNANFFDLGGHSLLVAQVQSQLRERLGYELSMLDLMRYPTVGSLATYLREQNHQPPLAASSPEPRPLGQTRDIAIIGMTGRFPGAPDIASFWANLCNGVESISRFSDAELLAAGVDPALLSDPHYVKARGVLEDIEWFDAGFFGLNPREAESMDPQHRIMLECAWHALESAGYDPARYAGRIGVFAGAGINTYVLHADRSALEAVGRYQAFIGNDKDFIPTRISYKLNLRGPSVNVQTACSTALVAVHLACQSLLTGDSDMVLAGGITIGVPHLVGYTYEPGGIPSPDGHCRAFDAAAQGTVFGNGVGIVVLKRLEDALADGDTIHAVIKGTAINNDGALKVGYTSPSIDGQAEVIRAALDCAKVDPASIGYVEAHGTGTPLGDPIEIAALTEAYRTSTLQQGFCAIGSVKTNIGHLDTAAGVAGLIKAALTLEHGQIPPSLHFTQPNPAIDFANSPFVVCTQLTPWPAQETPRRAGVSSFGIGGTNAHVILEEAPPLPASRLGRPWQALLLSARSSAALETMTANLVAYLKHNPDCNLADVAYTSQVGRHAFRHRRVLICRDTADALAALEEPASPRMLNNVVEPGDVPVVFMFSGQGAQYPGMSSDLYRHEPVFREWVDHCAEVLKSHLGLDIRTLLYPDMDEAATQSEPAAAHTAPLDLEQTWLAQPALFVVEYALARLLMAWGIQPQAMIGHSVGEYVAACLAGVFTLDDALALIAARGRLMQELPAGAMLAVPLPAQDIVPLLSEQVALAAINAPRLCVLAGPETAIAAVEQQCAAQGIECRRLHTSHAFHSAMMEPMLEHFAEHVQRVTLHPPHIPYIANVTGEWITAAQATNPQYWVNHVRQTVQFAAGIDCIASTLNGVLLEIGPGHTLQSLVRQHLPQRTVLNTLRHPRDPQPDLAVLLQTLGRLWLMGVAVNWANLYTHERRQRIALPLYPFERQRYWIDPPQATEEPSRTVAPRSTATEHFAAPVWQQSAVPPRFDPAQIGDEHECWVLFADPIGLGERLAQRLRGAGQTVVMVRAGSGFAAGQHDNYTLHPEQQADYDQLWSSLRAANLKPRRIVYSWSVTATDTAPTTPAALDATSVLSFTSLLLLVQALERQQLSNDVALLLLSNNMHRIAGESVVYPEKALLLGPCKVIRQEYPGLSCRSIDIVLPSPGSEEEDDLIDLLLAESIAADQEQVIAYRGTTRWVQTFTALPPEQATITPARLRERGVYLITGGLGGIGLAFAGYLAQTVQARLVLLGRSALPPRETWDEWLATHPAHDAHSRKIRSIQALEAQGAEVMLLAADVADHAQMQQALEQIYRRFGALHGVIHAAGLPGGGMMQLKTRAQAQAVLRPKLYGTQVLYALTKDARLDFMLLCSSINAIIGGFGQVDYCAANAFLDAFARSYNTRRGIFIVAVNWDRWQEVGMAVDTAVPAEFRALQQGLPAALSAHPLFDACISASAEREVYLSRFSPETHWILSEHLIDGQPTVPGTTYLEMARAAFHHRAPDAEVALRDVVFVQPLIIPHGQRRDVFTILEQRSGASAFRIMSRIANNDEAPWVEHAHGLISEQLPNSHPVLDLAAIKQRCRRDDGLRLDDQDTFLSTGPRWHSLRSVYIGEREGLAILELDAALSADCERFGLHPALLDVAVGAVQRLNEGNYLPFAYEKIQIKGTLPRQICAYISYRGGTGASAETISCDTVITTLDGSELVRIEGFSMRRVSDEALANLRRLVAAEASTAAPALAHSPDQFASLATAVAQHEGITPSVGVAAFARILAQSTLAQVVVSAQDVLHLIAQANAFTRTRLLEQFARLEGTKTTHARPNLQTSYVAPADATEQQIAAIWQQVLGIEKIGVHDSFFELGGTSLTGIQIIAEIKKEMGLDIPVVGIFEAPTIRALAQRLQPSASPAPLIEETQERAKRREMGLAQLNRRNQRVNDEF